MNRMIVVSNKNRQRNPKGSFFLMRDSWFDFRKDRDQSERNKKPLIYEKDYWACTNKVLVDIEIGKERIGNRDMEDGELLDKYIEKYELSEDCVIVYTDGSKQKGKENVRIGIVVPG